MCTCDAEFWICLSFLSHITNAEAADVVVAAGGDKDGVEVSQADRTVVLKDLALYVVVSWIDISNLDILFVNICLDPHFVSLSDLSILNSLMGSAPFFTFSILLVHIVAITLSLTKAIHSLHSHISLGSLEESSVVRLRHKCAL